MHDTCIWCKKEFIHEGVISGCCPDCADRVNTSSKVRSSILTEADKLVNGPRQEMYADPVINFERIADIASSITGRVLSAEDCCLVLVATKLARELHKHTRDNVVDCAGYLEIYNRIVESRQ